MSAAFGETGTLNLPVVPHRVPQMTDIKQS